MLCVALLSVFTVNAWATTYHDYLTVQSNIDGQAGNDAIAGSAGNDRLLGGLGNDMLFGLAGDDRLEAGEGNDLISGGSGTDTILAGAGDDTVLGAYYRGVTDGALAWTTSYHAWSWFNPQRELGIVFTSPTEEGLSTYWEITAPKFGTNSIGLHLPVRSPRISRSQSFSLHKGY